MNDLKQTRKTATPIHRGRKAMNKDLTSGNFAGDFGLAYPNALDWERINEWSSSIWREATGMQRDFWVTPGVSTMLLFLSNRFKVVKYTPIIGVVGPCYSGALTIFERNCIVNVYNNREELARGVRSRACDLVYVNTHCANPDGTDWKKWEMEELVEACRLTETNIIEDDPYFFMRPHRDRHNFIEMYEGTIYLNTFSKCFGSPAMRLGCVSFGNEQLREKIWGEMMKCFVFPNPMGLDEAVNHFRGEDVVGTIMSVLARIKTMNLELGFEGFYFWSKKDDGAYEKLIEAGYKVKDGTDFGGGKYQDFYRASFLHFENDGEGWTEITSIMKKR